LVELEEETGLTVGDLENFRTGEPLLVPDQDGNPWLVHTFLAVANRRRLTLNGEHDAIRWTSPAKISRFSNRVPWLDLVLQAVKSGDAAASQ
jgi:8-oxo-dGTP pyrophosphatase MutT (NUDIX family)